MALADIRGTSPEAGAQEIQLGPDECFVLGDNTRNSLDSRYYGAIKRGSIFGRVSCIFWPLERAAFCGMNVDSGIGLF